MSSKLLAVDMDGTLFDDEKNVSKENLEAITKLLDAGHVFAFDTGRPNQALKKILSVYKEFQRENVYMLGYQGVVGTSMLSEDILFGDYIDIDNAIEVINAILDAKFTCIVFDNGCIYTFNDNHFIESYKALSKEQLIFVKDVEGLRDKKITKIMAVDYDHPELLQEFKDRTADQFDDRFESFFSHYAFLEFVKRGTGKGDGIKKLAEYLNIPLSDVVACGDERNDISMVEVAGVGVAMANGRDELKAVADYITKKDNNNSGIAEVINEFFL